MGGSSTPPTQTTTSTPPPQATELMNLALPGVRTFAAQTPELYPGTTVPPFTPAQLAGQGAALQAAGPQAELASAGAQNAYRRLTVDPNAQRTEAINAATRPVTENFMQTVLPSIRGAAQEVGGLGGSRQGVAESLAARDYERNLGDIAAKTSANIYDTDVKAQTAALGLNPQTLQSLVLPATTVSGVGDVQQQQLARYMAENQARFNYGQYAPFIQSRDIMSLLAGIPGGTVTTTGSLNTPSTAQQALSGAASGAAAGATLGSVIPGVGTLVGAGVGALGGGVMPFLFR